MRTKKLVGLIAIAIISILRCKRQQDKQGKTIRGYYEGC